LTLFNYYITRLMLIYIKITIKKKMVTIRGLLEEELHTDNMPF